MPKRHANFRRERARELQQLEQILSKVGAANPGSLSKASNMCRVNTPGGDEDYWGYSLDPIRFAAGNDSKVFPKNATGLTVTFNMAVEGMCVPIADHPDPFTSLEMEMTVEGLVPDKKGLRRLLFFWHLDRDLRQPGDREQAEYHPRYHFQHGGNNVPETGYTIGDTLFLDPPRLIHPPMDAILAVDFVLSNFCTSLWYKLFEETPEYISLLTVAQDRCWRPFFEGMARHWASGPQSPFCLDLSPCLVPKPAL